MAAIPGDVTMVGGKTAEAGGASGTAGSPSDASSTDPDFRACEKLAGKDGIEACNRAIASGKFTGRELSYLYSDRGYLLMQKGALVPALADLNKAAEFDPTNFYAYWNRGALRMAESDFASAQSDFTTALSLNPDPASKAKIEEVLNVATEVLKASTAEKSEPGVITDPSQFGGELEGSASASSGGLPADVTPGSSYARLVLLRWPRSR